MKKISTILSILVIAFSLQASAQTKKSKTKPRRTTGTTVKTSHTETLPKAETLVATVKTTTVKSSAAVSSDDYYSTAIGVKFLYGIALTGKHFISDKAALEGIIRYRNYDGFAKEFNFTALYEYHGKIAGASGLRWYGGGGAFVGYYSFDNNLPDNGSSTTFAVAGVLGLEYKIKGAPLAISADWQPLYIINANSGFAADNGGLGFKYTF